jgi:CBS domain-containing protein/Flp pilus assembly pilin Flp
MNDRSFLVLRRFARRGRGTTHVEYAVVLALLVGGVLFVFHGAAPAVSRPFHMLADGTTVDADTSRSVHTDATRTGDEPSAEPATGAVAIAGRVVLVAVLAGVVVVFIVLRRRRRPKGEEGEPDVLASLPLDQRQRLFQKRQQILGTLSNDMASLMENRVLVRHLMSRKLVTVPPETPTETLAAMMNDKWIRHLIVEDGKGRLLGIVSDRDLKYRRGETASALMTRDLITVSPDTPAVTAVTTLMNHSISCLPVVEEDPVVEENVVRGIVTSTDLMMSLQCTLQILHKLAAELQLQDQLQTPEMQAV